MPSQQTLDFYASIGKTPDLIDPEGAAFWDNAFATGTHSLGDAYASANYVYSQPSSYIDSPYAAQNVAGMQNLLGLNQQQQPKPAQMATGTQGTSGNPYLQGQADDITRRQGLFLDDAFNKIRSNAIGVGGLGGSRQGVAQGVATGMAADSLTGNLANLYGNAWNADQNRDLSRYGIDTNLWTAERNGDRADTALGATLYGLGSQGPWNSLGNASSIFGTAAGNTGSTTNSSNSGGGWMGALGGALGAAQVGKQYGWW